MIPFGLAAICILLAVCLSFGHPWLVHPSRSRVIGICSVGAPFALVCAAGLMMGAPSLLILAILVFGASALAASGFFGERLHQSRMLRLIAYLVLSVLFFSVAEFSPMGWETVLALVLSLLVLCFLIRVRKDEADRRGFLTLYVVLLALMIGLASLTPGDFPNQTAIGAMFLVMSDSVIMKAKPMMILKVPETAATLLGQIMGLAMILMWVIEQT